jgi:hypothetical protein
VTNILEDSLFPVEITKTHDLRLLQPLNKDHSFNQSITDIAMPPSLTQDSMTGGGAPDTSKKPVHHQRQH